MDVREFGQLLLETFIGDKRVAVDFELINTDVVTSNLVGRCLSMYGHSMVQVSPDAIRYAYPRMLSLGGNGTKARSVTHGYGLVLVHEIRHAQQYAESGHPRWANGLEYENQPHEIDARKFVDERYDEILRISSRVVLC